jgi:hypothetical protein
VEPRHRAVNTIVVAATVIGAKYRGDAVRFASKTAPQNTTWEDKLPVWQEADQIELFESGWVFDHLCRIGGSAAEQARALADEGLDLAISYLPPPLTPAVLALLADALAPLA